MGVQFLVFGSPVDLVDWVDVWPVVGGGRIERVIVEAMCLTMILVLWIYSNVVSFRHNKYKQFIFLQHY